MENKASQPILITGSNGLLGQKLVKLFIDQNIPFLATSLGANRNPDCPESNFVGLDVTNEVEVEKIIASVLPRSVIHTAAMTNVDQCEADHEDCDKLNIDAVKHLWESCKKHGVHFQLLSTDFVFDGEKGDYKEEDHPAPLSYYGHSKYKAEQLLTTDESNKNWSIVRTIIVYGTGHNLSRSNMVLWALSAIPKGEEMRIVDDQFRAPTWADDLAQGCWLVVKNEQNGIFHISGPETRSILEWVHYIGAHFKWKTDNVVPISSATLNQAAKRPPKTGFDLSKSRSLLGYQPKTMAETLDALLKSVKE